MPTANPTLLRLLQHTDWFLRHASPSEHPAEESALWISSLDHRTGRHPEGDRPPGVEKRCYRWIESPFGSNLYWDLALVAAVDLLGRSCNRPEYVRRAADYAREYVGRATADNGLFLWGNHYYIDLRKGLVVWFTGRTPPAPLNALHQESAPLHEIRPLAVPWEYLHSLMPGPVEKAIQTLGTTHIADRSSGAFNRHADGETQHPFLEAGALQSEALCRHWKWTGQPESLEAARAMAEFSFSFRDPHTGLLPVSPGKRRWDFFTATSETGLWTDRMALCYEITGVERFLEMGGEALKSWLRHAWDGTGFYGKLTVADAQPVKGPRETTYQPGDYADPWEPLFPAHDYPMQTAQGCLRLFRLTGDDAFMEGALRWARVLARTLPARNGRGGYAESYGRALHFLFDLEEAAPGGGAKALADRIQREMEEVLWNGGLFRTHPGEDRCDAVDGLGYLFLSLLRSDGSNSPLRSLF